MAGMEKSGLDEMACHTGSVFLPSGCQEAESQASSSHGVCGQRWWALLRVGGHLPHAMCASTALAFDLTILASWTGRPCSASACLCCQI